MGYYEKITDIYDQTRWLAESVAEWEACFWLAYRKSLSKAISSLVKRTSFTAKPL